MKKILIAILIVTGLATPAHAAQYKRFVNAQTEEKLLNIGIQRFWGNAVDSKGNKIQPRDDAERRSLPVSHDEAIQGLNVGFRTGLGQWCGLSWQERFRAYMKSVRRAHQAAKEVAFMGMIHGIGQGHMAKGMAKRGTCSAKARSTMEKTFATEMMDFGLGR